MLPTASNAVAKVARVNLLTVSTADYLQRKRCREGRGRGGGGYVSGAGNDTVAVKDNGEGENDDDDDTKSGNDIQFVSVALYAMPPTKSLLALASGADSVAL